jgi:hypothetical protein
MTVREISARCSEAALDNFQVPPKERAEVLAFVESTKRDIVE